MKRKAFIFFVLTTAAGTALAQTSPEQLLLKDYRPKSIYRVPVHHIERAKFPVIDVHSHPYAQSSAEIGEWVKTMDRAGIEKTIILSMANGARFDSIYAAYAAWPNRFEVWCGFDFHGYDQPGYGPSAVAELERCYKLGARGVGELGDKGEGLVYGNEPAPGMHLEDPRMDPLLEKCAQLGMPVSIHVGDPIWMYQPMDSTNDGLMNGYTWRLDNKKNLVDLTGMVASLERAVARHPRTTFIACHFANCDYDLTALGKLLDRYPNLYADISARYAETAPVPRATRAFYEKYSTRLLYGTDMGMDAEMYAVTFRILESADEHFYEIGLFNYHWPLYGLDLSDKVLKRVYRTNALKALYPGKK
ncbi:MAG TPA: amidohydrolase family protein [bacterium]|nr:amidohydrolase family protein [bacterium]HQG45829.1 amidohydrolase family protein [bacterium]HQI47457.1 amidohydrolase family protein [bacterium]HQJ64652.1 amidohydrolase family protein [bacterium]